jgi:hypothetical protein
MFEKGPYFMNKGRYYVGDMSSVLTDDELHEFGCTKGQFTLTSGREVVNFKTPHGDGIYPDEKGRYHIVDSGTIGITLATGLNETGTVLGHTVDYEDNFLCVAHYLDCSGHIAAYIRFGEEVGILTAKQMGGTPIHVNATGPDECITYSVPHDEVDYIRPLSSFKDIHSWGWTMDTITVEMRKAFHFNNVRAIRAVDNRRKGSTYNAEAYAQSKEGVAIAKLEEAWKSETARPPEKDFRLYLGGRPTWLPAGSRSSWS